MSTGNSAMQPVQTTVFNTLSNDAPFMATIGSHLYDDVPASYDTLPYVQVGEINETIDNTFSTTGRAVEVTLHIYSQAKGWKESQLILEEMIRLLDEVLLPNPTGWTTYENHYVLGQEIRDPDGTRHTVARFVFHVERAGH